MEPTPETNAPRDEKRVYDDVRVLLEFLGQRADSLLQSHFDDTRGDLAAPARRLASPPCKSYKHFLSRLASIGRRLSSPDRNDEPPATRLGPVAAIRVGLGEAIRVGPFDEDDLSDPAFLSFSRDFLAAVAAPATVDSIRVTRAYVNVRRHSLWWRLSRWRPAPFISPARPAAPAACDESVSAGARRLASRVVIIEYSAMLMTLFTLVVSAYALSGQKILDSRQHIFSDYQQVSLDVATADKDWLAMRPGDVDANAPPPLCAPGSDPSVTVRAARSGSIKVAEATTATRTDAATGSMGAPPAAEASASPAVVARQCTLYWKRKHTNEDMTAVTLHLVSWTQVVLQWQPLGSVFGIDPTFIQASASLHGDWCKSLGYSTDCERSLQDLIYHTPEVANSLLGCIALYVLPTLYGCLGAAASVLRALRRKVELSLVTMTDRGRVQQDLVLGALCGAVMGLFAGYIGKAEAATGLGLSALALLAGYNVTDTLAFLDELCHRIFQPSKTGNA